MKKSGIQLDLGLFHLLNFYVDSLQNKTVWIDKAYNPLF
ncbi:hypothetical protein BSM4216_0370 [Bacillus smithii]|nr:hypothetical protein BSM4216_0370 [Bacillus smithii]